MSQFLVGLLKRGSVACDVVSFKRNIYIEQCHRASNMSLNFAIFFNQIQVGLSSDILPFFVH